MWLSNRSAAAAKLPTGNSAITNDLLTRWSGNTAEGRRARLTWITSYDSIFDDEGAPSTISSREIFSTDRLRSACSAIGQEAGTRLRFFFGCQFPKFNLEGRTLEHRSTYAITLSLCT
jgi:hypothetical protein